MKLPEPIPHAVLGFQKVGRLVRFSLITSRYISNIQATVTLRLEGVEEETLHAFRRAAEDSISSVRPGGNGGGGDGDSGPLPLNGGQYQGSSQEEL